MPHNSATPFNLQNPIHLLAVGFGSGLLKPAPGTWGSMVGALMVYATNHFVATQSWLFVVVALIVSVVGITICGRTANDIGVHDHGSIVWDEIAGMYVVMAFVPLSAFTLLLGFGLFRLFDIVKPWPIIWLDQHVDGGLGIMLDDIVAGVLAGVLLYLAVMVFGITL